MLSRADQKRLTMKAHSTHLPAQHKWLMMLALILIMIGGYGFVLLMKLGVRSTAATLSFSGGCFLPAMIWIGFVWVASAWACRFIYIKPIRCAMREEGYILCINCGYDLRGTDHEACPECGADVAHPKNEPLGICSGHTDEPARVRDKSSAASPD